jgi:site-specific DNA recombinase
MIAAIYARKSTEQAIAEDQKSVARQIAHARAYAARNGWTVDDACVFVDDGISGAEFAARPGYQQLLAHLKPHPPFNVLIMSESSRLGREAWETGFALKQILVAGVRVFFYLENRECRFDHPLDKLQFSIVQAFDEMERSRAMQRSTDKALSQARAGHVTGGRVFGYDNVSIADAVGRRSHVERRVNQAEAAIVRRIFELAASGVGQGRIARLLNEEGVASPRAQRGRPQGWAVSSVHEVLFRPLYRGELVWNRTRKRDRWGQKRTADRPSGDWIHTPAPELRIVPETLWLAAHARIDAARALYRTATKGLRGGRPQVESRYLLPGLARCAVCNGGLFVRTGNTGSGDRRRRAFAYACTSHHTRGRSVCANRVQMPMGLVDEAVLTKLRDEVVTPDLVDDVLERARELLEENQRPSTLRDRLVDEIAGVDRQLENLVEAIALGGQLPALVARAQGADARRQELTERLRMIGEGPVVPRIDWRATERQARQLFDQWRTVLAHQPQHARTVLRELLAGEPIRFTPIEESTRRGYRFEGSAVIGGLLEGVVVTNGNWRPHRDSNPGFSLERAAS